MTEVLLNAIPPSLGEIENSVKFLHAVNFDKSDEKSENRISL